ncbi:hypothetical protein [Arthrospiribacter ruber]|uniref:Uncharacterized protein n=1 Tax=Arthrospiribacter ruber TaxID=2487934 RepID=A0A951MD06_9BACT|nr:hypothetical protein [Arthrospiribacter ruber]MBW3467470.1 hypothetical protein [Arthrospiribacter ruber]
MKPKIYLLLFFAFFLAVNSCKDVEEPDLPPIIDNPDPDPDPDPDPQPTDYPTMDINVVFPENVSPDLEGAKVIGAFKEHPLQGNSSKVFVPQGKSQLAFLQDKDDNILLLGFINDKNKTLSIQSSAEALAFLGLGGFILPSSVQQKYPDEAASLPGMDEFKKKLAELYVSDNKLFETEKYIPALEDFARPIYEKGEEIDIRARQINVGPTGYKSGIQVFDNDFQSILIRNQYLRVAYAYLYKLSFKDKEGTKTELIKSNSFNPSQSPAIFSEKAIDAANKSGGIMGVLTDHLAGNGMEVFMKETGPVSIPLGANESEAEYAVRVVGPTFNNFDQSRMTTTELEKYKELALETFFKEALLPAVTFIINKNLKVEGDDAWPMDLMNSITTTFLKEYPEILAKVEEGKYRDALKQTLEELFFNPTKDAVAGQLSGKLMDMIYSKYAKEPEFGNFYDDRELQTKRNIARFQKAFELIEAALTAWDAGRMIAHLTNALPIEQFLVTAREHDIKLLPEETSVTVFTNKDFTVETRTELSDGQAFLYKWSTSGTYGTIRDNIGNDGKSFENGQKTVTYRATASNIPDDAKETITVVAYVKQGQNESKIGEATATVSVKPARLEIKPDGITLVGKEKQSLALYVEWANGDAFESTNSFEYKYEWSTPGLYGKFDGRMTHATTSRPRIIYQALDEDVEKGEENLKVDIYMKDKDGGDWFKYHTAEGKVKVENDDNYLIYHEAFTVATFNHVVRDRIGGLSNFIKVDIPKKEEYEEYTVRLYGFRTRFTARNEGVVLKWKRDGSVPTLYDLAGALTHRVYDIEYPDDVFAIGIRINSRSCFIDDGCPNDIIDAALSAGGMAEIKIKLK